MKTMQSDEVSTSPPEDKRHIVCFIMLMHGVGILMPWNMFINARSYFVDYKLSKNYTGEDQPYRTYFLSCVGFAAQIPNIIFNWINIFISIRGTETLRIVLSISVEVFMFVITIILAVADSSKWPGAFFWSTMVTIVIINRGSRTSRNHVALTLQYFFLFLVVSGIYQNTIFGMAAKLPYKYPGVVILGCNISGCLVSVIDLCTIILAPNIKTAAIYYFITALLVLIVCLALYIILLRLKFYKYYFEKSEVESNESPNPAKIPYWKIFKTASFQLFNVFFIFFVTLSIFPALQGNIHKSDPYFIVPEKYYISIMCFLTFNTAAMLGSILSNFIKWPSPKTLLIPVLLRGLFIPFFFFCNYQPSNKVRKVPVLITSDWLYWIGGILLGLTSGYLSAKAMIYTTGCVEEAYGSISSMFGAAVLVTGIFCGVLFSMIFPLVAGG